MRSAVVLLVFLLACGKDATTPPLVCDASEHPALRVAVRDSVTAANVGAQATLTATTSGAQPFVVAHSLDTLITIGSLGGTYVLRIQAPHYVDWERSGIVVPSQFGLACYPVAVRVEAKLQPLP